MPLKLERVDDSFRSGYLRIHYRDEFGQSRFFEFGKVQSQADLACFALELIRQVNELLARPRPAETNCRIRRMERQVFGVDPEPELHPDDVEYIDGQQVIR